MKKVFLFLFSIFSLITISSLQIEVNAEYVLDVETLSNDVDEVIDEIGNNSLITLLLNNYIEKMREMNFLPETKESLINKVIFAKNVLNSFLEEIYHYSLEKAANAFIASTLCLFLQREYYLSAELLLVSWLGGIDDYSPIFGFIMNDTSVISNIVHNGGINGSFEFNGDYTSKGTENDLFLSIHIFTCEVNSNNVLVYDTYDFKTKNTNYNWIFNSILDKYGRMMQAGYLSPYTIKYNAHHNISFEYCDFDEIFHLKRCSCGISNKEKHIWSKVSNNLFETMYDANKRICRKCRKVIYLNTI